MNFFSAFKVKIEEKDKIKSAYFCRLSFENYIFMQYIMFIVFFLG